MDMKKFAALVLWGLSTLAIGCTSSNSQDGGSTASGGKPASGGSTASGGKPASGGSTGTAATGGSTGNGGITGAGGSGTGGGTSSGGTTASTGGTGGSAGTSSCVLPSCLKNLGTSCAPSGNCTVQHNSDTGDANWCYANGVKKLTVLNISDYSTALTMTKSGSTCFTTAYTGNDFFNSAGDLIAKDASGATIATLTMDPDTSTLYIVTCPGGSPVTLDISCNASWPVSGLTDQTNGSCTEGTCTP